MLNVTLNKKKSLNHSDFRLLKKMLNLKHGLHTAIFVDEKLRFSISNFS